MQQRGRDEPFKKVKLWVEIAYVLTVGWDYYWKSRYKFPYLTNILIAKFRHFNATLLVENI